MAQAPIGERTGSIAESFQGDKPLAAAADFDAESAGVLVIPAALSGQRLDQALAQLLPEFSRSHLQVCIRDGLVQLDGQPCRPRDRVLVGARVEIQLRWVEQPACVPQPIPLTILYQDTDLLVLDKPAGLVVHPAAGNPDGTLQNGLLHHDPALSRLPRYGLVHRLDKDTSGLLVVARSLRAHTHLVAQLQAHTVKREYLALVNGVPIAGGCIDLPIGRHPTQRMRRAVTAAGKPAVTHFRVAERFIAHSLLEVRLETGRTHQIRVHLAHLRFPVVGDPVYGGRLRLPSGASASLIELLRNFRRQALHARRLALIHPGSGLDCVWETPPPADFQTLLEALHQE